MTPAMACDVPSRGERAARAAAVGIVAAGVGLAALQAWPALQIELFAAGAARLAALFTGAAVQPAELGWVLAYTDRPVVVSAACSGTDYYLMVVALIGWRLFGGGRIFATAVAASLAVALPLAMVVNALRVVAVAQAHRWVIPHLPEAHGAFAHMLTGIAIFLPSLIALNLVLENHGNRRRSSSVPA